MIDRKNMVTLEWAGELLALLPERAIWWQRESTLFIADPHFGKASTFRFAGIAVPELSHLDDLHRLESLLREFAATRLVILGDFFHARAGRSQATLSPIAAWRDRHHELEIILIQGNHDRHAGAPPDEWRIRCVKGPWPMPPFACCHEPQNVHGSFVLSGHWHPSFRLSERLGSGVHSPCFYFTRDFAVLPAYGNFTGRHPIEPQADERIFLVGPDEVIEVAVQFGKK
jgi:DNA ligase-associated metallophosphoesterase